MGLELTSLQWNMGARAVFLDRDGVLNRALVRDGKPYAPQPFADWTSPCRPRGSVPRHAVEEIHQALRAALPLDDILACYHNDCDACQCRKPEPGLLLEAARERAPARLPDVRVHSLREAAD